MLQNSSSLFLMLCSRLGLERVSCGDELDRVRQALTAGLFTNAVRYESTSYDHLNMGDAGSNVYTLLRSSGKGADARACTVSAAESGAQLPQVGHLRCSLCRPCSTAQVDHALYCSCLDGIGNDRVVYTTAVCSVAVRLLAVQMSSCASAFSRSWHAQSHSGCYSTRCSSPSQGGMSSQT